MNVLITVMATRGSAPRERGTWMAVGKDSILGTLGGGNVEHQAIALARAMTAPFDKRFVLGPMLGQCCGGVMDLRFEFLTPQRLAKIQALQMQGMLPVALFGGGHVGRAIVHALTPLPYRIHWMDSREGIFPSPLAQKVRCEHSDPVHLAVQDVEARSCVLVMSFNHAEDFDIVQACLRRLRARDDLPFVGLIGSGTKWATFRRRLMERGFSEPELARITCPIGLPQIRGKEPEVIAASVAAQLLSLRPAVGA